MTSINDYIEALSPNIVVPDHSQSMIEYDVLPDDYIFQKAGVEVGADSIYRCQLRRLVDRYTTAITDALDNRRIAITPTWYEDFPSIELVTSTCICKVSSDNEHEEHCNYKSLDKYMYSGVQILSQA